jgi:hypothetical protein
LQADDGYLYPLERAFFYVHKPPTLIVFDEIESVEFLRQGGGLIAASAKTFDLNVRQRNIQQVQRLYKMTAVCRYKLAPPTESPVNGGLRQAETTEFPYTQSTEMRDSVFAAVLM